MEHQLNNPLRPSTRPVKSETTASGSTATTPTVPSITTSSPTSTLPTKTTPQLETKPRSGPPTGNINQPLTERPSLNPEVKKALDAMNAPEELRKLMAQLAQNGIEIAGPKKVYVKHSYEIDQDLHQRFHEMYPVLGFKKVKDAINDAISLWCEQNEVEFKRRSGPKK